MVKIDRHIYLYMYNKYTILYIYICAIWYMRESRELREEESYMVYERESREQGAEESYNLICTIRIRLC